VAVAAVVTVTIKAAATAAAAVAVKNKKFQAIKKIDSNSSRFFYCYIYPILLEKVNKTE
jgi:hypothetical protein